MGIEGSGREVSRRVALGGMGSAFAAALSPGMALGASREHEDRMNTPLRIRTHYYQHFDADYSLEVPEEHFGGWKTEDLAFSMEHTAVVVMHAWAAGQTPEEYPGWWRCVPYIPRANAIVRDVFPGLLGAVRKSGMTLFHVVGGGDYYKACPGYQRALALAPPEPPAPGRVATDPIRDALNDFRAKNTFVGAHNREDVNRGFSVLDFAPGAEPQGEEGVAENGRQLFGLCQERGINHLVYCGFAINWCLLLSPGGMHDMQQYGLMCSALRQATTAVENKASAREEWAKEIGLWRVALAFGFVFDVEDFVGALSGRGK